MTLTRSLVALLFSTLVLGVGCNGSDSQINKVYPSVALAPEVLSFGDSPVDYSSELSLTVINSGQVDANLSDFVISGPFSLGEHETVVPANDQISIPISFLPTTYESYAASILMTTDDPEHETIAATLTGTGIYAPTPDICVEPLAVDFGAVTPGSVSTSYFTIGNCGDGPLNVASMEQSGSGAFSVIGDPTGFTLAGDQEVNMIVNYAPVVSTGDTQTITLNSDDPDEPVTTVTLIGNGGGSEFSYPVPEIVCPTDVAPRDTVTLDGTGSYDPEEHEPLTYAWFLIDSPTGSQAELSNTTNDTAYLATDIAGDYAVQLMVINSIGVPSAPKTCAFTAVPDENIHVELTWSTASADVDLHLLNSSGQFYVMPDDCNWCNQGPNWGTTGSADDPSLDIDDRFGYGPENTNIDSPADDTYSIKVHYFTDNGDTSLTATVKVYLYGDLAGEASASMTRDQVWDAGLIQWPDGLYQAESSDPYEAPRRTCQ